MGKCSFQNGWGNTQKQTASPLFPAPRGHKSGPGRTDRVLPGFGRGLLAPSHAGTRLPIAAVCGPGTGRSPSARSRPGRGADVSPHAPFGKDQKTGCPVGTPSGHGQHDSLRWHDPHQVKGRSAQLPLSPLPQAPLSFATVLWARRPGLSRKIFGPWRGGPWREGEGRLSDLPLSL